MGPIILPGDSIMAVQKSKKSPSRRGMRRGHDSLATAAVATDRTTGGRHLRHHLSAAGHYRGRQVKAIKPAAEKAK